MLEIPVIKNDGIVLEIRDANYEIQYRLDTYESLVWVERFNGYSDFEIKSPMDESLYLILMNSSFITRNGSIKTMYIDTSSVAIDYDDSNNATHFTIGGKSVESFLMRRIIWNQTTITGKIQPSILKLLSENAISPKDPNRTITGLAFEDVPPIDFEKYEVDAQFTGTNLYEAIVNLCDLFDLGFRIIASPGKYTFSLDMGVNRSLDQDINPQVIFSPELDNLISSGFLYDTRSYRNVALVAGEGEGLDRKTVTIGNVSGLVRRETYIDARDVSSRDPNNTQNSIPEKEYLGLLTKRGETKMKEMEVIRDYDGNIYNGISNTIDEDFYLGDIVHVTDNFGNAENSRVIEVAYIYDMEGPKIIPKFSGMNKNDIKEEGVK